MYTYVHIQVIMIIVIIIIIMIHNLSPARCGTSCVPRLGPRTKALRGKWKLDLPRMLAPAKWVLSPTGT